MPKYASSHKGLNSKRALTVVVVKERLSSSKQFHWAPAVLVVRSNAVDGPESIWVRVHLGRPENVSGSGGQNPVHI